MKKGETKFRYTTRGKTGLIHIPADIVKDSAFPFKPDDKLIIEVKEDIRGLVITKKEEEG